MEENSLSIPESLVSDYQQLIDAGDAAGYKGVGDYYRKREDYDTAIEWYQKGVEVYEKEKEAGKISAELGLAALQIKILQCECEKTSLQSKELLSEISGPSVQEAISDPDFKAFITALMEESDGSFALFSSEDEDEIESDDES